MATDSLSAKAIRSGLATRVIGRELLYLSETGSTNDQARRLAGEGAPDGTLVIADYQTAGRGRHARRWSAPPASSLLLSIVFRPALTPERVPQLTMLCSLAAAEAVEDETGLHVAVKWPNDLLLGDGKLGGILSEVELAGDRLLYAVVGLGLNVNLDPASLPGPLLMPAASLSAELGRPVSRLALLVRIMQRIEERYLRLGAGDAGLPQEWAGRLVTIGQIVTIAEGGAPWQGRAESVDADGALLVRRPDGELVRGIAGDVIAPHSSQDRRV